ncbi:MAG: glycosyltransferase family 4 protein [Thermoprotei archaeon]
MGVTEDTMFLAGGRLAFIKLMKALACAGNSVVVISSTGATEGFVDPAPARVERVKIPRARIIAPIAFVLTLFFRLPKRILQSEIILVNSGYTLHMVVMLSKFLRRKVVVLQHDVLGVDYLQQIASSKFGKYTAILRWIALYTPLKTVDGVFCISNTTMKRLRKMGYNGPAYVIGNVVS